MLSREVLLDVYLMLALSLPFSCIQRERQKDREKQKQKKENDLPSAMMQMNKYAHNETV